MSKKWALVACVGAFAASALGASAASAAPAAFNAAAPMKLSGPFTLKAGPLPGATVTCDPATAFQYNMGNSAVTAGPPGRVSPFSFQGYCLTGTGAIATVWINGSGTSIFEAQVIGSDFSLRSIGLEPLIHVQTPTQGFSASGTRAVTSYSAAWTNGTSTADPSTATFVNVPFATSQQTLQPITFSGTLKFNRIGGGVITMQ